MNITKPHPNIAIRTTINVDLSADQWRLNTDDFPRTVVERVATFLNKKVTLSFNQGDNRSSVEQQFDCLASHFKMYGATSSNTQSVLNDLLDKLFVHHSNKSFS